MLRVFGKKDVVALSCCVVFILLTLGAIGSRGRRRARKAVCLSNLRKWGELFGEYVNDNDGYFHPGPGAAPAFSGYWVNALRDYHKNNRNLCCCPEAAIPMTDSGSGLGTFSAWGIFGAPTDPFSYAAARDGDYGSYGVNIWVCNPAEDQVYPGHLSTWNWRTANIAGAAKVPLLVGSMWFGSWPENTDQPPPYEGAYTTDRMSLFCLNRHEGYVNGVFVDFSARKIGLKELWTLKWHRNFNTEGPYTLAGGAKPGSWPTWMRDFEDY